MTFRLAQPDFGKEAHGIVIVRAIDELNIYTLMANHSPSYMYSHFGGLPHPHPMQSRTTRASSVETNSQGHIYLPKT